MICPHSTKASTIRSLRYQRKLKASGLCTQCRTPREKYAWLCNVCHEKSTYRIRRCNSNAKTNVIAAYGGACVCCGETERDFLTIDHALGNGAQERRLLNNGTGARFYQSLRRRGYPKEYYRLLCMNCNFAIGHFGACPHNRLNSTVKELQLEKK